MSNTTKNIAIGGAIAIVIGIVLFGITGASIDGKGITGNAVKETTTANQGDVQEVKLTFKNYEYQLEPSILKKDVPVKMIVDLDSVYGCMRDVVIPSANVKKYVREGDNIIEFTPTKAGEFNIMCSMNMGRGKFIVIEDDGSKSSYVEESQVSSIGGTSSGSSGGSCGCGAV